MATPLSPLPAPLLPARRFHGQRDALVLRVRAQHVNLHDLADLHHIARLLDVAIRQLADVHQSILMDAHIHKRSELGHVGDNAFQRHTRSEVANLLDALLEGGREKLVARVSAGFAQLLQNVVQRVYARGDAGLIQFVDQRRLLNQLLDRDL